MRPVGLTRWSGPRQNTQKSVPTMRPAVGRREGARRETGDLRVIAIAIRVRCDYSLTSRDEGLARWRY